MRETENVGDAALIAAAGRGDERAFRLLYRAYVRPVYWIAHGLVGTAADAEEVTQETFLAAWRKLPGMELAGESALPWLATICRFQAANRLRKVQRDRAHTTAAPAEELPAIIDVEHQVITSDLADRILQQIQSLGELDREIFRLCATEGYAYEAAAEALGVSHGTVRNRLSRIRTRLRETVAQEGE